MQKRVVKDLWLILRVDTSDSESRRSFQHFRDPQDLHTSAPLFPRFFPLQSPTFAPLLGGFFRFFEIYKILILLHRSDLKISAKNRPIFCLNENEISFFILVFR